MLSKTSRRGPLPQSKKRKRSHPSVNNNNNNNDDNNNNDNNNNNNTNKSRSKKLKPFFNLKQKQDQPFSFPSNNNNNENETTVPQDKQKTKRKGERKDYTQPTNKMVKATDSQQKVDQKAKKQARKAIKPHSETVSEIKSLWESVRQKSITQQKKNQLMDQLMKLIKGKIQNLTFKHDASRVIQTCVKYGNQQQREIIFDELKGSVLELSKSQYGHFLLIKMLHYASKTQIPQLLAPLRGHLPALIRHKEASAVIEYAYREICDKSQKADFIREFYGPEFILFKESTTLGDNLEQILSTNPAKRGAIMKHIKETLEVLIQKQLIHHSIVHRLLREYVTYGDKEGVLEMLSSIRDQLIDLINTSDGSHVVIQTLAYGPAKDKKSIIKGVKEKGVVSVATDEFGHIALIVALHYTDDIVLLQKALLSEMLNNIDELITDKYGGRLFLYLFAPLTRRYFPPNILAIFDNLSRSLPTATVTTTGTASNALPTQFQLTTKKDPETKRRELIGYCSNAVLKYLIENSEKVVCSYPLSLLLLEFLKSASCSKKELYQSILNLIDGKQSEEHVLNHPIGHRSIKRMLLKASQANDNMKESSQDDDEDFGLMLFERMKPKLLEWASGKSSSFVVAALLEYSKTSTMVSQLLKPHKEQLQTRDATSGIFVIQKLL